MQCTARATGGAQGLVQGHFRMWTLEPLITSIIGQPVPAKEPQPLSKQSEPSLGLVQLFNHVGAEDESAQGLAETPQYLMLPPECISGTEKTLKTLSSVGRTDQRRGRLDQQNEGLRPDRTSCSGNQCGRPPPLTKCLVKRPPPHICKSHLPFPSS